LFYQVGATARQRLAMDTWRIYFLLPCFFGGLPTGAVRTSGRAECERSLRWRGRRTCGNFQKSEQV